MWESTYIDLIQNNYLADSPKYFSSYIVSVNDLDTSVEVFVMTLSRQMRKALGRLAQATAQSHDHVVVLIAV